MRVNESPAIVTETINGVALERSDKSGPALMFLHGFACDRHDWRAQIDHLSERYCVVALDLPGHGLSPPDAPAMQAVARAVGDVVTRMSEEGVILVGHSLGCRVALEVYRQRPEGIVGLVLLDNGEVGHRDPPRTVAVFDEQLKTLGVAGLLKAGFAGMFVEASDPALRERVMDRVDRIDAAFSEALLRDAVRWGAYDAKEILAGVEVPILLLQSTARDENNQWLALKPGMTTPWTELVSESASDVELVIIPGVGHFLQIEAPAAVNVEIEQFVTRITGKATPSVARAPC